MATNYRGAQVTPYPYIGNNDLADLVAKKANLIRYQIVVPENRTATADYWKTWVRESLDRLDELLPSIPNTKVVIDIHTPPGGYNGAKAAMFSTKPWGLVCIKEMWQEIATKYKDNDSIFVYGILNEPGGAPAKVNKLMRECVELIRAIDPNKRISVTCAYSDPANFDEIEYIASKNIWYELHCYYALAITHQGIDGRPYPKPYPSPKYTKGTIVQYLAKARAFQVKNRASIFLGEFSISSFATDASRIAYLADVTSIAESYGWNWTYHAWREASVWNIEGNPDVASVIYKRWKKNVL